MSVADGNWLQISSFWCHLTAVFIVHAQCWRRKTLLELHVCFSCSNFCGTYLRALAGMYQKRSCAFMGRSFCMCTCWVANCSWWCYGIKKNCSWLCKCCRHIRQKRPKSKPFFPGSVGSWHWQNKFFWQNISSVLVRSSVCRLRSRRCLGFLSLLMTLTVLKYFKYIPTIAAFWVSTMMGPFSGMNIASFLKYSQLRAAKSSIVQSCSWMCTPVWPFSVKGVLVNPFW